MADYSIACAGTRITVRNATLGDATGWGNHVAEQVYELMLAGAFKTKNGSKTLSTQVMVRDLADRGHRIMGNPPAKLFGGAQLIAKIKDGYCAASDHRKDGQAVGF